MRSTTRRSAASSVGSRRRRSRAASKKPSTGISTIATGGTKSAAASTKVKDWGAASLWEKFDEGHYPRRRLRHAALSADPRGLKAALADLRQADDLLPAVDLHVRRHSRHPHHHDAVRRAAFPEAARRRRPMGLADFLCAAALARRHPASLPPRP